jgi:glycosyltransferase involved in cell wall biosynthesis
MKYGVVSIMSIQQSKARKNMQRADREQTFVLSSFPVDMSSFPILPHCTFDAAGVPSHANPAGYHPVTIAHYALAQWNQYIATGADSHRKTFLAQATWFVEYEIRIGEDAGGWPISLPHPSVSTRGPWLSALAQGCAISVLLRAYQLTGEEVFLAVAQRAVRTFEQDILDGGVSAPLGANGVFFEEVAVYPAAHMLSGFVFALFGLYDYVACTGDARIEQLIQRSLTTLQSLQEEFDVGYWTRSDLLNRRLATPSHLALQIALLEVLARQPGGERFATLTTHWKSYQRQFGSRLRYLIASRCARYSRALWGQAQTALFPTSHHTLFLRVCVPVTGFPVIGGIRTFLAGIDQVMGDKWQMEYLTQHVGPHPEGYIIHRFGMAKMSPWQFPNVWFYFVAGCSKLITLMRHGAGYNVILPQDGVFTAAFTGLAAKLAGVRVVCIDHGNLTLLKSRIYRTERVKALTTRSWLYRLLGPLLLACYWPSQSLLARLATRSVDHFLIPGVAGDGVEENCKRLGVHASRLTRFASMVDLDPYAVLDDAARASGRAKNGIAVDAIIVAMVCRLTPEKGIGIALEAISRALPTLPPAQRERVRVIIAGEGPLRKNIEEDIRRRGLSRTCVLWGEASPAEVISLLSFSDIFLYTSTRGACFSMAILEAIASGCAVIASTEPLSNAPLLAEGRGIAVPPCDAEQTTLALVRLLSDLELCRRMGDLARDYLAVHHSAASFRRTLMRATSWAALDELVDDGSRKAMLIPRTGGES